MRFDKSHAVIAALPPGPERAIQYAVCGLLSDETHHKQWALEQILEALGVSRQDVAAGLPPGHEPERGVAP